MVQFGATRKPPNYLGRGVQRRIFLGTLVLATFLVGWQLVRSSVDSLTPDPERDVDTRVAKAAEPNDPEGTFLTLPPAEAPVDDSGHYFPGVRPGYLEAIRDDTVWRRAEHHAWFHLLDILAETPQEKLDSASTGPAAFVQLYRQPAEYRGELVTVEGLVHWAHRLKAPSNLYGIDEYYQLWLQTENSTFPILVYALELPAEFPTGEEVDQQVRLTGFFYKRYAYDAKDGLRTAPLLLAKGLDWQKVDPAANAPPLPLGWAILATVLGILGLSLLLARYSHPSKAERLRRGDSSPNLHDLPSAPSVEESLHDLSQRDEAKGTA